MIISIFRFIGLLLMASPVLLYGQNIVLIPTYLWGVITVEYSTSGFNTFLTGIILGF